jgi:hypothetical protein
VEKDAMVESYLQVSLQLIKSFATSEDIKVWWEDTADDRTTLGLVKGNPAYSDLVDEVTKRVNLLKGTKQ